MESIDIIIMRFLHIFAGMIWVGAGITTGLILHPLAKKMGEGGSDLLRLWYARSLFAKVMPVVSITTTLAGLFLYARLYHDGLVGSLTQAGTVVLSIGALAGLLAFGHGVGIGRASGRYAAFSVQVGDQPNTAQRDQFTQMENSLARHGNISLVLMVIAVIGMSIARYL